MELLERALRLTVGAFGREHPQVAHVHMEIGGILAKLKDFQNAANHFSCGYSILQAKLGDDAHPVRQAKAVKEKMERACAPSHISAAAKLTLLVTVVAIVAWFINGRL
jgi:hypothetical protein